jgi:hypothetical protein
MNVAHLFQALSNHAGFLEFVTNRKQDTDRDGMDWRFSIVKEWADGGEAGAGSEANYRKLLGYIRQGPYDRDAQPQVATQQG